MKRPHREAESGFTLLEALASVAVVGLVLMAIGAVAGEWLPHWRHGFAAAENADLIAQALDRMAADLAAAEYAHLDPETDTPLFRGAVDAVAFVRSSSGPGASPGLEVIRIGAVSTPKGVETQRAHTKFAPGAIGAFRDGATLLRPPFRLALAYAGPDGHWLASWSGGKTLPRAVRLTVSGANGDTVASSAVSMKVTAAPQIKPTPSHSPQAQDTNQ
jgi:general secretion pathway protein J